VFTGSLIALVTSFDDNNRVDYSSLKRLIDFHVEQGSDALVIAGTTDRRGSDAVEKPVMMYNVPGRTVADMLPETVARLAKHENVFGYH
jgi:4-hydroxy-tetrahydrodipicolinate synthase